MQAIDFYIDFSLPCVSKKKIVAYMNIFSSQDLKPMKIESRPYSFPPPYLWGILPNEKMTKFTISIF